MTISSFIMAFLCSLQALQKIHLANHIWSLAELLHADAVQQLEVVLLGIPAAKILDMLLMAITLQPHTPPLSKPPCPVTTPASTSSMIVASSQVPMAGVTQVPGPETLPSTEAAISEGRPSPSTSADPQAIPSKCRRIMPTPLPITSSSIPNLPSIVVLKLAIPTTLFLSGSTIQGVAKIINAKYVHSNISTEIVC